MEERTGKGGKEEEVEEEEGLKKNCGKRERIN